MEAVEVVRRTMEKTGYAINDGFVYKKIPEAKYTFVHCSNVNDFIMNMLGNIEIATVITPVAKQLINFLSQPACRLIKPIEIDFNYIEVEPFGTCFDIEGKRFVADPKGLKPNSTPRAYVKYLYDVNRAPDPTKFIEGKTLDFCCIWNIEMKGFSLDKLSG